MAWTSPRTWVAGEIVRAATMNVHVRDNMQALRDEAAQDRADADATFAAKFDMPVNVKDYGAVGNGVADDTAAIQDALNVSTAAAPQQIYFPAGTYKITAELLIPAGAHGTAIVGESKSSVHIEQQTAGQPIFAERSEMHSIEYRNLTVRYPTTQTDAGSVAFLFSGTATDNNFYRHIFDSLVVQHAYRCWSVTDTMTSQSLWASAWTNITCLSIKDRVLYPSHGTGAPASTVENFHVYNTDNPTLDATSAVFYLRGAHMTMRNVSVEGWTDQVFYLEGGASVYCDTISIEQLKIKAPINAVCHVQPSSVLVLSNWGFDGVAFASNDQWSVFLRSASTRVCRLLDGKFQSDQTAGTAFVTQLVYSTDPAAVVVDNCLQTAGDMTYGTGFGAAQVAKQAGPVPVSATRTETASYTIVPATDHRVIANGATVTVTLPDATTVPVGTEYVVKNINGAVATVNAAGSPATIDGAASDSLAQWETATYISDGSNWLTL